MQRLKQCGYTSVIFRSSFSPTCIFQLKPFYIKVFFFFFFFCTQQFLGNNFGMLSGTSMATPHIAGVAALIKQNNPSWTPSMIASAMSTTARKCDNNGDPIMAEGSDLYSLYTATPFDFGAGLVNPSHALDPGLVFSSGNQIRSCCQKFAGLNCLIS